jgi:hypothetical protein
MFEATNKDVVDALLIQQAQLGGIAFVDNNWQEISGFIYPKRAMTPLGTMITLAFS